MRDALIELGEVRYRYPGAEKDVLNGLSFALRQGERVALLGANGSGKSTMLRLIAGLILPDAGTLSAFGKPRRSEEDFFEVRAKAGLLFQNPDDQLFCATVAEDVAFGPFNLGKKRQEVEGIVKRTLELVGLPGFETRVSSRLSGGERRLVSLACVLAMEPEALLLDEPNSGLDSENSEKLLKCLKASGKTMLIASHDKEFLNELATSSALLKDGRIAQG
jgi:cobalt/nickel transport system ATP-binding protein